MDFSLTIVALLCIFLAAGSIKGTLGIGLPTSAISMMSLLIAPQQAVSIVVLPILVANSWQIYRQGEFFRIFRTYWLYSICIFLCLWLTSLTAPNINAQMVSLVMGISVISFVLVSVLHELPPIPPALDKPLQAMVGIISGLLGGICAVWAPPVTLYLLTKRLEREEFVRVSGFLLGTGSLPLTIGSMMNGSMSLQVFMTSLMMVGPTLIGFGLGEKLRPHLNGAIFRRAIFIFFFVMGLNMLRTSMG